MKTSKQCIKCSGTDIYCDDTKTKHTDSRYLPANKGSWSYLSIDVFICMTCGYIEEYVSEKSLKDEKLMKNFKFHWKKLQ